jgi:hypothetical protein
MTYNFPPLKPQTGAWWQTGKLPAKEGSAQPEAPTDDLFLTLQGAHPDHWVFRDPITTKRLRDLLRDSQAAKETTPEEDARLTQERGPGQRFSTDKAPPSRKDGETDGDHEFLEGEKGATAWQKTKKL